MPEETDHKQSHTENSDVPKRVEVTIVRHKQFFEMLKEPQTMWRVLLSLFFITVIVVIGLSFVVISVKRFYPYNTIQTNMYGATIMKNEDKEVIYWLFNTAELWANSGIKVKKNDELTIRASGASFTAIHHLVEATKNNKEIEDKWVDTEGQPKTRMKDRLRVKYRIISNNCDEGKLLLMVADEDKQNNHADWVKELTDDKMDKANVEIIGKEKISLKIKKDGILHFAVNDIILTDNVIAKMYKEFVNSIMDKHEKDFSKNKNEINSKIENYINNCNIKGLEELNQYFSNYKDAMDDTTGLMLGFYPGKKDYYPLVNELVFYKEHKFRDAWFVDNIGSFLIVIERKR